MLLFGFELKIALLRRLPRRRKRPFMRCSSIYSTVPTKYLFHVNAIKKRHEVMS